MVGEGLQTQKLRSSSVENPELTNIFPLKRGAGQNIAVDVVHTARNVFFSLIISTFTGFSISVCMNFLISLFSYHF